MSCRRERPRSRAGSSALPARLTRTAPPFPACIHGLKAGNQQTQEGLVDVLSFAKATSLMHSERRMWLWYRLLDAPQTGAGEDMLHEGDTGGTLWWLEGCADLAAGVQQGAWSA